MHGDHGKHRGLLHQVPRPLHSMCSPTMLCFNFYFKAEEKSREAERKDREAEAADREVRMWWRGCSGFMVHGVDELFQWTSSDAQSVQVTEGTQALHGLTNRILENGRKRSLH